MTAVFITVYRHRTLPKISEKRLVHGQTNQIIIQKHTENNNNTQKLRRDSYSEKTILLSFSEIGKPNKKQAHSCKDEFFC